MKNNIEQLEFSLDFIQACEIFNLTTTDVLQKFVDNVSLPYLIANPMNPDRWASTFMVECVLEKMEDEDLRTRYAVFLDRITHAVLNDIENKEEVSRQVMDEWHKAVLEGRIHDIMKNDEDDSADEMLR